MRASWARLGFVGQPIALCLIQGVPSWSAAATQPVGRSDSSGRTRYQLKPDAATGPAATNRRVPFGSRPSSFFESSATRGCVRTRSPSVTTTAMVSRARTATGRADAAAGGVDGTGEADGEAEAAASIDGLGLDSPNVDGEASRDGDGLEAWLAPQPTMSRDSATATVARDRPAGDIGSPCTSGRLVARETLAEEPCYTVGSPGDDDLADLRARRR